MLITHNRPTLLRPWIASALLLFCAVIITIPASAQTFSKLADFGATNTSNPDSALVQGTNGNFYGTTFEGSGDYGSVFNVTATLSGDGKSILNGTYTPQAGNACSDPGGTITGTQVAKLSGTYAGQMCPLASATCSNPQQDFTDTVTATVAEKSVNTLTLSLALQGTDNTTFTMTGSATGNAFSVTGTFQGQTITYLGYYEQIYDSTLQINIPSVYLVNATNPAQPAYVGTLAVPQT